jgi:hypothetical protein
MNTHCTIFNRLYVDYIIYCLFREVIVLLLLIMVNMKISISRTSVNKNITYPESIINV